MCSLSETCKTISDFSNCLKKLFYFLFHELLFESEVLSTSKFENLFVFEFIDSKKKSSFFKSTSVLCIYFYGRKECIRNDKIKTNITVYDDKNLNDILLMYKLFLNRIPKSNNAYLLENKKKPF